MSKYRLLISALVIVLLAGCLNQEPTPDGGEPIQAPTETQAVPSPTPSAMAATPTPLQASPTPTLLPESPPTPTPLSPTPEPSQTPTEEPTGETAAPEATPTPGAQPTQEGATSQGCTDIAAFYGDVNYPDDTTLRQGETFEKIWKIRNVGTCDWDQTYSLTFAGGEQMSGPISQPMPSIPAGGIADISVSLTAPNRGGEHTGYWQFADPGGNGFGVNANRTGLIWTRIVVSYIVPGGTPTPAPVTSQGGSAGCSYQENPVYVSEVLDRANEARAAQGLPALNLQSQLSAAALEHSIDMGCNNFVGHTGSDGSTWYDRAAEQGYANNASTRENIYVGNPAFGGTPEGAFNFWLNSQVHRENLLNTAISDIGIAYVFVDGSEYGGYYTTVFARP